MAIATSGDPSEGVVYFDSATAAGGETVLTVAAGKIVGIEQVNMTGVVTGEYKLAFGHNLIFQFANAASGQMELTAKRPLWGTSGTDIVLTSPAGAVSGVLLYRLKDA